MAKTKKRRIVPTIREISLAYNPKNQQRFLMRKDDNDDFDEVDSRLLKILNKSKGGNSMEKLLELLKDEKLREDQEAFEKELDIIAKDENFADETVSAIKAARSVIVTSKDNLPENFVEDLINAVKPAKIDTEKLKKDLRKELEDEIRKELEKEMNKSDDERITSLLKANEEMKKALDVVKAQAEKEREIRKTAELKRLIKDKHIPGDANLIVSTLLKAEKVSKELYDNILTSLTKAGEAIETVFKETGTSLEADEATDVEGKLNKLVDQLMEKDEKLTRAEAMVKIGKENPELWNLYRQGRKL